MSAVADVQAWLEAFNTAWAAGEVARLEPWLHPEVIMVLPGFSGRVEGRAAMLAGFEDYCRNAVTYSHSESDYQVDVRGGTAVASFRFEVLYERDGGRWLSSGRDLWVLVRAESGWQAMWRTMLDLAETPA